MIYLLTCLNKFIHENERGDHIRCYVNGDYLPFAIWIKKHKHVDEKGPSSKISWKSCSKQFVYLIKLILMIFVAYV